jgi:hypothetical protein
MQWSERASEGAREGEREGGFGWSEVIPPTRPTKNEKEYKCCVRKVCGWVVGRRVVWVVGWVEWCQCPVEGRQGRLVLIPMQKSDVFRQSWGELQVIEARETGARSDEKTTRVEKTTAKDGD